jgi:hypothetical protein
MNLLIHSVGLFSFCCFLGSYAFAQSPIDLLAGNCRIDHAVIPFYSGAEKEPSAIVSVNKFYTDYESKGFFKIGLLPFGVFEGVNIQIQHLETVTNSLEQIQQWLCPHARGRIELHNVTLLVAPAATTVSNRLFCQNARIDANGNWNLSGDVRFQSGISLVRAEAALLQVVGDNAGCLVMKTTPISTNHLFASLPMQPTKQEATK